MLALPVTANGRPFWLRRQTEPSHRQAMVLWESKDILALAAGFVPDDGSEP
jgi:hypothetical protein